MTAATASAAARPWAWCGPGGSCTKRKGPTMHSHGAQAAAAHHPKQTGPAYEPRGGALGVQCCPAFPCIAWTRLAYLLVPSSSSAGWHAAHLTSACCRHCERPTCPLARSCQGQAHRLRLRRLLPWPQGSGSVSVHTRKMLLAPKSISRAHIGLARAWKQTSRKLRIASRAPMGGSPPAPAARPSAVRG